MSLFSAFLAITVFGAVVVVFAFSAFGAAAMTTFASSFLTEGALAATAVLTTGALASAVLVASFLLKRLAKLHPLVSFLSFVLTFSSLIATTLFALFAFDLFVVVVFTAVFDKFSSFLEKIVSKVTF